MSTDTAIPGCRSAPALAAAIAPRTPDGTATRGTDFRLRHPRACLLPNPRATLSGEGKHNTPA
jgi:hypothetical protein